MKPFIDEQKNNNNNAETIAEAALRPNLPIAAEKSRDQLVLQVLHRIQVRPASGRTTPSNRFAFRDRKEYHAAQRAEGADKFPRGELANVMTMPGIGAYEQEQIGHRKTDKPARMAWSILRHRTAFDAPIHIDCISFQHHETGGFSGQQSRSVVNAHRQLYPSGGDVICTSRSSKPSGTVSQVQPAPCSFECTQSCSAKAESGHVTSLSTGWIRSVL